MEQNSVRSSLWYLGWCRQRPKTALAGALAGHRLLHARAGSRASCLHSPFNLPALSIYTTGARHLDLLRYHHPACASASSAAASCRYLILLHTSSQYLPFILHLLGGILLPAAPLSPRPPSAPRSHPTTCRPLTLVGRLWPPLSRRQRYHPATSLDLFTHFYHLFYHCIAALSAARCTIGLVCPLLTRAAMANRPSTFFLACARSCSS